MIFNFQEIIAKEIINIGAKIAEFAQFEAADFDCIQLMKSLHLKRFNKLLPWWNNSTSYLSPLRPLPWLLDSSVAHFEDSDQTVATLDGNMLNSVVYSTMRILRLNVS